MAPSVLTATGGEQFWMGLLPAVQVKLTVTFELFQLAALGAGDTEAVIVGGVLAVTIVALKLAGRFVES